MPSLPDPRASEIEHRKPLPSQDPATEAQPVQGQAPEQALHVHLDCPSGLAGDMFLAACVDAGVPAEPIREVPRRLGLEHVEVRFFEDRRGGLRGLRCEVTDGDGPADRSRSGSTHGHSHDHGRQARGLATIRKMIDGSGLESDVRERAVAMFTRLAEIEAAVHGVPLERVHFHEVGAVDSLVDIVGSAVAWCLLGATSATVSDVVVGSGRVTTEHGIMPVPAPATAALLEGRRCVWEGRGELLTPTGALILDNMFPQWSESGGRSPVVRRLLRSGVGLGHRELDDRSNGCRLSVLATSGPEEGSSGVEGSPFDPLRLETIDVVQTQVDDVSPEQMAHAVARLRALPSTRDVFSQSVYMKKGRTGWLVTVHCDEGSAAHAVRTLVQETGTLGCRVEQSRRWVAEREVIEVDTRYGPVAVKVGRLGPEIISVAPEAEDCQNLARAHATTWRRVYDAAHRAALERLDNGNDNGIDGD